MAIEKPPEPEKRKIRQGSPAWYKARIGKVTASAIKKIMTNGRGKDKEMGETGYTYLYDLIAERETGKSQDDLNLFALDYGNDNEPAARALYALRQDAKITLAGFEQHPDYPDVGGSPDAFVGEDGGLEIKSPLYSRNHFKHTQSGGVPTEYYWQVQSTMWITKRKWWDFVSFDPRLSPDMQLYIHREYADPEAHAKLEDRVQFFLGELQSITLTLRERLLCQPKITNQ